LWRLSILQCLSNIENEHSIVLLKTSNPILLSKYGSSSINTNTEQMSLSEIDEDKKEKVILDISSAVYDISCNLSYHKIIFETSTGYLHISLK
jgi:hypothetical protein